MNNHKLNYSEVFGNAAYNGHIHILNWVWIITIKKYLITGYLELQWIKVKCKF